MPQLVQELELPKEQAKTEVLPHIGVCICTYQRPDLLKRLLDGLKDQESAERFTYSVVVVDNDKLESAKPMAEQFSRETGIVTKYVVEPRQNIAMARNKAIESVQGDFVAFIDDDEFPSARWLLTLFEACQAYSVDGVLGPVKPHFDSDPPSWVVDGKFYDRPSYPTGLVIDGPKGRTGNVLLKRRVFDAAGEAPFRPEFLTGEDQDFFRRMIEKGFVFVWCHEAMAYEVVPPVRWSRGFMLRRALLRGANSLLHPTCNWLDILKSAIAVPAYALAAPFALLLGQAKFMLCIIKMFDHLGKLLALIGIHPIKQAYVTE